MAYSNHFRITNITNTHCNTNKDVCVHEFCMYFTNITIMTGISWNKAVHSHVTCRLSSSWEANRPQLLKDFLYYLQPENLLRCSQEQMSLLYPESDESSPAIPPTPLLSILTLFHHMCIQWNRDLSFLKGTEKTNDECGKTINPNTWCFQVLRSPNLF